MNSHTMSIPETLRDLRNFNASGGIECEKPIELSPHSIPAHTHTHAQPKAHATPYTV